MILNYICGHQIHAAFVDAFLCIL